MNDHMSNSHWSVGRKERLINSGSRRHELASYLILTLHNTWNTYALSHTSAILERYRLVAMEVLIAEWKSRHAFTERVSLALDSSFLI